MSGTLRGRSLFRCWKCFTSSEEAFSSWTSLRQQHQDSRGYTHFKSRKPLKFDGYRTYIAVGALGLGGAAYVGTLEDVPYTHRKHSIWISTRMERMLGKSAFEQIKAQAQQSRTLLPSHHPDVARIRRIGLAIVEAALQAKGGGYMEHMQDLDWEFIVVRKEEPNAMVVPGGKVIVHSGLLDAMHSDDEIAAVLGHEVAHVVARHVAEKLSKAQIFELLRVLVFWTVGIPIPSGAVHLAVFLPNSRKLETEADTIGMQIAAQSCFDPAASVQVFRKLGEIERRSSAALIPGFLRTHPLSDARIQKVQNEVSGARQGCHLTEEALPAGPSESS